MDSSQETFVEEAGASNFFCLDKDGVLHTPELDSHTILPGVTRSSVMYLAKNMGTKVVEGKVALDYVLKNGREVFCTGTGASITPVGSITFKGYLIFTSQRQERNTNSTTERLVLSLRKSTPPLPISKTKKSQTNMVGYSTHSI